MVPSEAVPFVYLASVCQSLLCLISALTQAGGGGLLVRLLVSSCCGEGLALLSPSTLLRLPAALYGAGPALCVFPALGCSTKARPAFCAFPAPAAQAARSLMGALSLRAVHLLPSASPGPVPACAGRVRVRAPCVSPQPSRRCRPSRISGSLWLETGGLFAVP